MGNVRPEVTFLLAVLAMVSLSRAHADTPGEFLGRSAETAPAIPLVSADWSADAEPLLPGPWGEPLESTFSDDPFEQVALRRSHHWDWTFVPYGWMPWTTGTQVIRGRAATVQASPTQALAHLEQVPFLLYTEARRDRLGIYLDTLYGNVGLTDHAVRTRASDTLSASLGLNAMLFIGELGGVFEIARWDARTSSTALDVLGGVRYWHQEGELYLQLTDTLDIRHLIIRKDKAIAKSGGVNWVDPIVGARLRRSLRSGHELYLRGDVGGFEGGSQFTWNITTAWAFELCASEHATISGALGYRLLDVDFTRGSGYRLYVFDMLLQGPFVAGALSF